MSDRRRGGSERHSRRPESQQGRPGASKSPYGGERVDHRNGAGTEARRASAVAVTPSEKELREMLLDAHERLLRRDEEILRTLGLVLDGSVDPTAVLPTGNGNGRSRSKLLYRQLLHEIREVARTVLPHESTVLVVSKGDEDLLELGVGRAWHFPRGRNGAYAGFHPRDSAGAIAHLEELHRQGAEYLLLPWTSVWWLEHYSDFRLYLERHYPAIVRREQVCLIYALGKPQPVVSPAGARDGKTRYRQIVRAVKEIVQKELPPGAPVLVVSKGDDDLLELDGRPAGHFPQTPDGAYAGYHPADGAHAILELEKALTRQKAGYLVFPASAFWWFEHYPELERYLHSRYRSVWWDDDCVIYDLAGFLRCAVDERLPEPFVVGKGNLLYITGWCYHTASAIQQLEVVVEGEAHPVRAFAMPRSDVWQGYASPLDSDGFAFHSGFWALVPFAQPVRDGPVELELQAVLADGTVCAQPLAKVELRSAAPALAGLGAPPPGGCAQAQTQNRAGPTPVGAHLAEVRPAAEPPLVAICMTTYDPPLDLLERQIRSIQEQTFTRWKCVISDDGSSRKALAAIRALIAGDPRFALHVTPRNLGFYRNVERCLSLVPPEVEFVALADQDDYWHPEKLEALIARFDAETTLAYSDMNIVDAEGRVRSTTYWTTRRNNYDDLASLLLANTITGAASVFRRSLLDHLLPFPEKLGDSYHDHWIACTALALGKIGYVDRSLYDYVQHGRNVIGHYTATETPLQLLLALKGWLRRRRPAAMEPRLLEEGRAIYFAHVLRITQFARILDMRCGDRVAPSKLSTLRRIAELDHGGGVGWLALRGLTGWRKKNVTLGAELRLLQGLLWRRTLSGSRLLPPPARPAAPAETAKALPPTRTRRPAVPKEPLAEITQLEQVSFITRKIEPLRLRVKRTLRRVNVLIGIIDFRYVFGGYITVFHLARRLHEAGLHVRLVIVDECDYQPDQWKEQFRAYPGLEELLDHVEVAYAHDRKVPLEVSPNDALLATSWWTAHIAHEAARTLKKSRFVYLSQDYEPIFYPMGAFAALANESYTLPHYAIFSTELLRDYFRRNGLGVYAGGELLGDRDSISFRNAITPVRPPRAEEMATRRVRKLLFYSRPEAHNSRNLFEIGVLGLCRAIEAGCFPGEWEFYGIGALGSNRRMKLARGKHIELLPRMSLQEYQTMLCSHDIGLSLMYSPHPSLVPIEMASAGMLTVTNRLFNKTEEELHAISTNFVVADATVDGVEQGLKKAVGRIGRYPERVAGARVNWSRSWDEAFDDGIRDRIVHFLEESSR